MPNTEHNKRRRLFSKFYDKQVSSLYRFVFLKVNSEDVAKDIVAESFTRLWDQVMAPTEVKDLRAYLYGVARNLVVNYYRERNDTLPIDEVEVRSDRPTPEDEAVAISDSETVKLALSRLQGSYQDILIFYYVEGRSVSEISEMKDKSENAVRVMIHRAMKALEDEMSRSSL